MRAVTSSPVRISLYATILFLLLARSLWGGLIVGSSGAANPWVIDSVTGSVTAGTGNSFWVPISPSWTPGNYISSTLVNFYDVPYPLSGFPTQYCATCPGIAQVVDFAYDVTTGSLYTIRFVSGVGYQIEGPGFSRVSPSLRAIEAVPGWGIYGTDGFNAYRFDFTTGIAVMLPRLHYDFGGNSFPILTAVTGLAYDRSTGRLIGSTGVVNSAATTSILYNIDLNTGSVNILNYNAPNLWGIAAVNDVPEEPTSELIALGLALVAVSAGIRKAYSMRA